jgi:DNA polymerase I-like protein with 3'-5' exonuclease and polymerase domains
VILVIDTENTTHSKGSPFDQRNFNVCISWATDDKSGVFYFDDEEGRKDFEGLLRQSTTLVFFNGKYDLHWLRKLSYDVSGKRVWCGQTAEFHLGRMLTPYPDLDGTAAAYNLGHKVSTIKTDFWDKGINTHEIPRDVLSEYAIQDARLTLGIYKCQQERLKDHQRTLFSLLMQDLCVLQEMEWNGLHFDKAASLKKAEELTLEIDKLQSDLSIHHSVPCFNWGSPAHLSALLYGGTIPETKRIPNGVYKTGAKAGETKFKLEQVEHKLPRRYTPIRGSLNANGTTWSVDESYLRKLQGRRELIDGILRIKSLKKLVSTYLLGLPALHEEMHFPPNYLHGQLVQCVAVTGRLASNSPNLQNISGDALDIFTTRYA